MPSSRPSSRPTKFMDFMPRSATTTSRPIKKSSTSPHSVYNSTSRATSRPSPRPTSTVKSFYPPTTPKRHPKPSTTPKIASKPNSAVKTISSPSKNTPKPALSTPKPTPKPTAKPTPKPIPKSPKPTLPAEPTTPKSPFINAIEVEKRPLSPSSTSTKPAKNIYTKATKPASKDLPAMVTDSPSRGSNFSLFFAILFTTILGGIIGAVAYFAFFQK